MVGAAYSSITFEPDSIITQTVGTGITAVGKVLSYDSSTGVLKYWQDRTLTGFSTTGIAQTNPTYGFDRVEFTGTPSTGGNITISNGQVNLTIDTDFNDSTTVINNRTYYLGQSFVSGVSNPEVQKHSGDIIYVDNRPSVKRSSNQKEDIKVILQF